MNKYTLYCTEQQTKMALELDAPIYTAPYFPVLIYEVRNFFVKDDTCYYFPTTEQMINWLENQEDILGVCIRRDYDWFYQISLKDAPHNFSANFHSRKEATLAAIDAALEYLISNKK